MTLLFILDYKRELKLSRSLKMSSILFTSVETAFHISTSSPYPRSLLR